MQCTSPVRIRDPSGPALCPGWILVPCGKCMACRIAKTREWAVRLLHESGYHDDMAFVTLTYAEEFLPEDESLDKRELQNFLKRLRKGLGNEKKIKYFACGEYGDRFFRAHYHAIIFGIGPKDVDLVRKAWPFGFVEVKPVMLENIKYVTGYVKKKLDGPLGKETYQGKKEPFQLQSKGLGKQFALDNKKWLEQHTGVTVNGKPLGLPRYYRNFIDVSSEELFEKSLEAEKKVREKFKEMGFDADDDYEFYLLSLFASRARKANLEAKFKMNQEKRKK